MVYTAGSAWVVDIAPIRAARADHRPLRAGDLGRPLASARRSARLLLRAGSYEPVWAFAAASPLLGALIASRIPEPPRPAPLARLRQGRSRLFAREAFGPGLALTLATLGYAALAGFVVLHLDDRGIGHGAAVFTAFAFTVVAARILAGWLPDRYGAVRCAVGAAVIEAAGLVALALRQTPRRRRSPGRSPWAPPSR